MSTEEWKPIPGYEALYEASTEGRLRSLERLGREGSRTYGGIILRQSIDKVGRPRITLSAGNKVKSFVVAVLVCGAFRGPKPLDKDLAAHEDGDPAHNRPDNLRWATFVENEEDKRRHGRVALGEKNGAAKMTAAKVIALRGECGAVRKLARKYGISAAQVSSIRRGASWGGVRN